MQLWAIVSAVALFLPTSTFSQDAGPTTSFKNGTQLYQACTAASESQNMAFCIGYVMGVSDSLQSLHLTCSPKEATGQQVVDLVVTASVIIPMLVNTSLRKKSHLPLRRRFPAARNKTVPVL